VQTENNKADKSRANKSGHFHVLKTFIPVSFIEC
jgi:hypothetical protein